MPASSGESVLRCLGLVSSATGLAKASLRSRYLFRRVSLISAAKAQLRPQFRFCALNQSNKRALASSAFSYCAQWPAPFRMLNSRFG